MQCLTSTVQITSLPLNHAVFGGLQYTQASPHLLVNMSHIQRLSSAAY